ncbi:MAG: DUF4214 domain-containing protein, partial [Lachnospiraceae bacterium]|nr:DUF4214 domain-containing protein [Lachnospiraceae bacterium]
MGRRMKNEKKKNIKKQVRPLICMMLSILMVVMTLHITPTETFAATSTKFANLVLYVSFSDSGADYWNDKGENIYRIYNTTGRYDALSVKDYFTLASCEKMELENIMPQLSVDASDNTIIVPITLSHTTEYYSNADSDYDLIQGTLSQLNSDSSLLNNLTEELDYNNDGYIDNVTFLVASAETERDSQLYPHKANAGHYNLNIKGKYLNAYNVINYGRVSSAAGGAGVVAHELLHVLEPLDTYRICNTGVGSCGEGPVGCWDIMAETSAFLQYPLAYTRNELGWIEMQEGLTSGHYTLTSPQADSNQYSMLLKTPYSDTEIFVIEYRKQGSFYNEANIDKIDDKIGGSGIIVYRVNMAASTKSNLTEDYIYVFRSGESEATATKTNARNAYLSAESGRTCFGSSDVTATTIDGAITYTDGTNSGIIISNVNSAGGDSISFDIEYSIDMTGKYWEAETYQSLLTTYDSGAGLDVTMLNGQLYGSNVQVLTYNGKIYGLYSNASGKAELLCYENGAWKSVKVLTQDYCYDVDFEVGADGLLYILCGKGDYSGFYLYTMTSSGTITDATGTFTVSGYSVTNPKLAVTPNGVVICYRDYLASDTIHVFYKQGTTWKEISTGTTITGNYFQICANGNDIYLTTANGNGNYVYQCNVTNSSAFVKYTGAYSTNETTAVDMFFDGNGTLYVAYYDTIRNAVLVQGYQDNSWKQVGMNVFSQMVSSVNGYVDNGTIYIAYQGSELKGIKSHSALAASTVSPIPIQSITLNRSSVQMNVGSEVVLQATIQPQNTTQSKTIAWSSSNPSVATVNASGKVNAIASGTTKITATAVNGVKTTCTVTVVNPYTDTEAFVVRLYNKCLGREPDASGLNAWNEALVTKRNSGVEVGWGFVFSQEYKNKHTTNEEYVEMMYQVFLDRPSDPSGKAAWVDLLNQGVSREYVFYGFAHSQEYTNLCNSYGIERGSVTLTQPRDQNAELTKFVNRLYVKALERPGEEEGLNAWCNVLLSRAQSPEEVAECFINSYEFQSKNLSNEEYVKVL